MPGICYHAAFPECGTRRVAVILRLQSDEAWVLRTLDLGESDLIVHLFCRVHGGVRGVARSARKSRRRFGGTLEPLTRVQVSWSEKQGRDLQRIDSMECARSYANMQREPVIQAVVAIISELASLLSREGQPDSRFFKLIGAVADALEADCDPWIAVRYFEFWTLRVHGVLPETNACAQCGEQIGARPAPRVDRNGIVRCRNCTGPAEGGERMLREIDRLFLEEIRRKSPLDVRADRGVAGPSGTIEYLLHGSLESFIERRLRSYRHLKTMTRQLRPGGQG